MAYMGNSDDQDKPKKSDAQLEFERKRIWSIAGGVTFLLAYVIYNGIVSVEFGDEEDDDDVEYEMDYEEYDDEEDVDL